ncbi:MAG: FKBP-type peptidyl-prolyl cis-trans isomerase [Myxococcales bacterium]|nr:FKBP-type peptidyl-prolyl cis-trans isomerase [Myxococcales bacterium]
MLASRLAVALALAFSFALAACNSGPTPPTPTDVAAPPASAETSASGLAWRVLTPGTGTAHPSRSSTVTVRYPGSTTDGELFDSSVRRGSPSTFRLDQVIRGWTEGVQLMVVGEQRRFWIPAALAYDGIEGRPQGTLVFDIELIAIE